MKINISPPKITAVLALTVVGLTLSSVAGQISKYYLGHDRLRGGVWFFNLDAEGNAPSVYSSLALFFCSVLLASIGAAVRKAGGRFVSHWMALSFIFLFMSATEALPVYNMVVRPIERMFKLDGLIHSTWLVPILILLLTYYKFLLALPAQTRFLFIISGSMFWAGAVGAEIVNLGYAKFHGQRNITYVMMTNAEEFLEMASIVIFIYALTSYMASHMKEVRDENAAAVDPQQGVVVPETELVVPTA